MRALLLCGCASLVVASCPAFATTYLVAPDSSGDFLNIQAAIDAATSGDEILLTDGTFTGDGNWDLDFGTKELVLRSENGYETTVLYGGFECISLEPTHRAVVLQGGQTAATRIEGVTVHRFVGEGGMIRCVGTSPTIRNVRFNWNHGVQDTHGLSIVVQGGAPSIENCVFEANGCDHGAEDGMAVYARDSWVNIRGCSFSLMEALYGGLVNIDGGTIEDCVFARTNHGSQHYGVCVVVSGGEVSIQNCRFVDGAAEGVRAFSAAELLVGNCRFEHNSALSGAGVSSGGASTTIRNTTFRDNLSDGGGGVVECFGGSNVVTLEHCVFDDNTNFWPGGGSAFWAFGSDVHVMHCTFVDNRNGVPGSQGSALTISQGTHLLVDHTIVAFGGQSGLPDGAVHCVGTPGSLFVTCSNFYGNEGGDWTGCVAGMDGTNGNISADPLFCDVAGGDLSLQVDSPCAPANAGECGLIGAIGPWCGPLAVEPRSWGSIKAGYR